MHTIHRQMLSSTPWPAPCKGRLTSLKPCQAQPFSAGDEIDSVLCSFRAKNKGAKPKRDPAPKPAPESPSNRGQQSQSKASKQPAAVKVTAGSKGGAGKAMPKAASTPQKPGGKSLDNLTLSKKESDKLFDEVARTLAAKNKEFLEVEDEDDWEAELDELHLPAHTASPAPFKGFGAPPRELQQLQQQQQQSSSQEVQAVVPAPQAAPSSSALQAKSQGTRKNVPPMRIFLYAADAKQTQEAISAAGWSEQVVISPDLRSSHVVVSVKTAGAGKHNKLQQGERTARNAQVPFVCVGRKMSKNNLVLGLAPVLVSHRAKHGVLHTGALAAAVAAAGVPQEQLQEHMTQSAKKLEGNWKQRMMVELGMMER